VAHRTSGSTQREHCIDGAVRERELLSAAVERLHRRAGLLEYLPHRSCRLDGDDACKCLGQ
jgi:hypothetical protein